MRSLTCNSLRSFAIVVLVLVGGNLGYSTATASDDDPKRDRDPEPNPYLALASRATQATPELDGVLDEPAWALAQPITNFVQREPDEGDPATERTEAFVLFDDGALYVGIRAYDSEPDKIVGRLTRRDQHSPSDWLIVSIDSYHDRRTAFEFRVNPAGVERDQYRYNDTNSDLSWNAVWDVATSVDAEGWTAEFRIPFSQLRFPNLPEQTWGFNIERVIQRKNEVVQWKPIPREAAGWVSEYGDLVGIQDITPPRRLEVLPYFAATQAMTPRVTGNPFETGSASNGNIGGDLRFGLTSSLTLAVTVNPDFGQVEADPSEVNLSAFETFFQERRPFFVEGASIFRYSIRNGGGAEQLFYSRRIGRRPQGSPDERGGYANAPNFTTILGAAKLSGKTADGWSIGLMDAVTGRERALVIDSEGIEHRDAVEPLTNYGVLRVQRDFREGRSALGGIITTVHRDLSSNLQFLRSSAYSAGIDGRTRFWGDNWEIAGRVLGSQINGSKEALSDAQTNSARYFQRPDADHLEFDPDRTSMTGTSGAFSFGKIGGGHWRGDLSTSWSSPGFEVNDLGFLRTADVRRASAWVQYREFEPGKIFRDYNVNVNAWNFSTFGGERTATGSNINGNFTLLNYWGGWGGFNRGLPSQNIRVLRGGPSMKSPGAWNWWYGLFSDNRKPIRLNAGGWMWDDDELSNAGGVWANVTFRPSTSLQFTIGPEYSWTHDDWQYVTDFHALDADQYVLGVLDQKTLWLTTRLEWTFTTNLSLQLYAQPFISSGDYTSFSALGDPQATLYEDRFDRLGDDRLSFERGNVHNAGTYNVDLNADGTTDGSFEDPNFNFKQFRSTLVLRWEYLSGSTLFFVWASSRTQFAPTGDFSPLDDLNVLRRAEGENIFSMKVNYYLSL